MKKSETRILEMLVRVRQYGLSHTAAFPEGSRAHELYDAIDACIKNMEKHATTQTMHGHAAREKTAQKNAAGEALRELMEAINRTARSMSRSTPGLEEKFRLPASKDMQTWLATARVFASNAEPMAEEFIRRGMAPGFIDDLKTRTLLVEQYLGGRAQESSGRVASTAGVAGAAEQGVEAVRELDAIVRNTYAGNDAELAGWESASHVERAPRHAEEEEEAEESSSEPAPVKV